MAKNIIIILSEGDHDAAFLYRILKANGFKKYSKVIKDFPKPLDNLFASDILNISVPDESIQSARTRFLPSSVVTSGENILLTYAIHGDSRGDKRIKLIDTFNTLNTKNANEIQAMEDTNIAALYFLDADNKGVDVRLAEINTELSEIFQGVTFLPFTVNATVQFIGNVMVGIYIFVETGKDTGKLEDVLLPMMEAENKDVFLEAKKFLSIHENTKLFKGKVRYNADSEIIKVFEDKYDIKKSLIGTIGQLQKSGKSNTVCISDANYLNDDKLKSDTTCNEILAFIKKVMILPND